jgi:hypothetical protein
MANLGISVPIYVTRKSADGETGSYSLSLWMTALAILLVWTNVVVWGVIGLVEAVRYFA